ncbi:MAG: hypothetical protein HOW97_08165 [Catenulispora sp.]|nr:hypothetical protein [Catenulispora sp.]
MRGVSKVRVRTDGGRRFGGSAEAGSAEAGSAGVEPPGAGSTGARDELRIGGLEFGTVGRSARRIAIRLIGAA